MATKTRAGYIMIVCLWLTIFTTQTLCQNRSVTSVTARSPQRWPYLPMEEMVRKVKELHLQQRQEELKKRESRDAHLYMEAWMRLLRIPEKRWKSIEPAKDKTAMLTNEVTLGAISYGGGVAVDGWRSASEFWWGTYAEQEMVVFSIDKMTEGQRVVDELIALLRDDNATDQQIRRKTTALQEARARARQALPQAKQTLRRALTSRRQEAVFLLRGLID